MRHTELMQMNLPDPTDHFGIAHFNENTQKIEAKFKTLNGVSSTDKAELLARLTTQQARLDELKRNDYRIFIKKRYQGKNVTPKGYWFELFANDSNQDKILTPEGFVTEGSCVKMWYATEVLQLGRTNNHELVGRSLNDDQPTGFSLTFPTEKRVPNGIVRFSFFVRAGWSRTLTCTFQDGTGPYVIYKNFQINQSYQEIVLETRTQMPVGGCGIFGVSGSEDTFYFQRENSTPPGGIVCSPGGGNIVGTLSLQNIARTGDYLYTKEQTMPTSFTKTTLFTRSKRNSGESITPQISFDNGGTWRTFSSPIITSSVNSSNQPCEESRYFLTGFPYSTKFKLRFYFSRSDQTKTPELYDYCVLYE